MLVQILFSMTLEKLHSAHLLVLFSFVTDTSWPGLTSQNNSIGSVYTYSTGARQHLYVNQPELVKELNQCFTLLGKPSYLTKRLAPMLGNGILRSNGPSWAQQRKIVAPEFFMDKVKVPSSLLKIFKRKV